MKFLHAADIHLDGISRGIKAYYGSEPFSISEAIQEAFKSLIDLAIKESVDFIVFPGDLFDSNWKDYSLGLFFIEQIKRVHCPIYYIRGNHDAENRLLKKLDYPSNFFEFPSSSPSTFLLDEFKVALHGQSYAVYHTREDLSLHYPDPVPGYFNIGLLHTSGDTRLGISPYAPYDPQTLKEKGYDYWALGHIHNYQVLETSPYIVYSGNIQGRHIHETGSKGCCIVSLLQGVMNVKFHPLTTLVWEKLSLDISEVQSEKELKEALLQALKKSYQSNIENGMILILRVIFSGTLSTDSQLNLSPDYIESQVYSWIQEVYFEKIKLERVENESQPFKSLESLSRENPLLEKLLMDLEEGFHQDETKAFFQKLVSGLKSKSPSEYKQNPFLLDLEEQSQYPDFLKKVKESLRRSFMEEEK